MTTGKSTRPSDLPLLIVTTSPSTSNSSSSGNRSGIKFNSSKNCNGNGNGNNDDTMKSQRGVRVIAAEKYFTADHPCDNSTTSSLGHDESHHEDDDDDDDDDGPITATNKTKNQNQNLTELAFLSKLDQSLLSAYNSSSDESSYWSTSDDDDDSDDDEEEDNDDDEDNDSEDDNDHEENDQEGLEASREDPSNYLDTTDDIATDAAVEDARDNNVMNHQRRPRSSNNINHNNNNSKPKRNDSVMSLDALLKLSMQLGDIKKPSTPIAVSKEARRRGRRLNKEHTVTSLGALARKVGSSTNNDLRDETTSGLTFRRCESATNIPKKSSNITSSSANHATNNKKFFLHIQQQGSPVKGGATVALEPTVVVPATKTKSPTDETPPPAVVIRKSTLAKYGDFATHVVPPRDHYLSLLKKAGIQPVVLMPYDKLDHFFVPNTLKDRAAFDMELVQCIRDQNLTKLQELHTRGHHMSARAQCGESILHICARRGTPDMLRYLLDVAKVSPRVCCDYGRTPLHDAAWSTDAKSLKMMHILITACPDLLLILDKRGFMPLDYIPKDRWPHCCAFLDKHKDSLLPTGVLFGDDDDEDDDDDSEEDDENDDDRSDTDSNLDF